MHVLPNRLTRHRLALAAVCALLAVALPTAARPFEKPVEGIDEARASASAYVSLDAARADGYEQLFECVAHAEHGSMGVHYIHPGRAGDGRLVLTEPDVLMYEPQKDGSLQLVAVEYIVFEKDWRGEAMPEMFGRALARRTTVGPHEVDPFYQVHVWHWRHNPAGLFADHNPYVTCAHSQ
jgi:hypothetical protein